MIKPPKLVPNPIHVMPFNLLEITLSAVTETTFQPVSSIVEEFT